MFDDGILGGASCLILCRVDIKMKIVVLFSDTGADLWIVDDERLLVSLSSGVELVVMVCELEDGEGGIVVI